MKFITAIFFCVVLLPALAEAGQAEVRDVALANNCTPKKVDVYKQSLGAGGDTIYQVQCALPKTVGATDGPPPADALLISCNMNLCEMLRTVTLQKK